MTDSLFIGASKNIGVDSMLRDACLRLTQLGIPATKDDVIALKVENGKETHHDGGLLRNDSYTRLLFKNAESYVGITQFDTEIVPRYSIIREPFTIGVSVWVGANTTCRLLAACVAAAIAAANGTMILDSELKWSDIDLNTPDEFIAKCGRRHQPAL